MTAFHNPQFDGETYEPGRDQIRLKGQLKAVHDALSGGGYWTLQGLQDACQRETGKHASEASVSARIRDLRKPKFGNFNIERQHIKDGVWWYRMVK